VTTTKVRRPCANCPWRVDAPRGYWDPQHFVDIWKHCQDDGLNIMLCHKANAMPEEQRDSVPCQGWIRVLGFEAIGVRLLVLREEVTDEEIRDPGGPDLFPSFAAMMRANKISLPRRSRALPRYPGSHENPSHPVDPRTLELHRTSATKAAPQRPVHPLNDKTVTIMEGAVAKSAYKGGSDYLPGLVMYVIAVQAGRALLAGPHGLAYVPADVLVEV
jgi:hypothetical protein